jgi:hypothetical protein
MKVYPMNPNYPNYSISPPAGLHEIKEADIARIAKGLNYYKTKTGYAIEIPQFWNRTTVIYLLSSGIMRRSTKIHTNDWNFYISRGLVSMKRNGKDCFHDDYTELIKDFEKRIEKQRTKAEIYKFPNYLVNYFGKTEKEIRLHWNLNYSEISILLEELELETNPESFKAKFFTQWGVDPYLFQDYADNFK